MNDKQRRKMDLLLARFVDAMTAWSWSPRTIVSYEQNVRVFLDWLVRERVLLASPFAAISLSHPRRRLPQNVLTEEDVLSLFAASDLRTDVGRRDRAVLEVLYATALRRAELVALDVADLDLAEGTVLVRNGKGGRSRIVPLGEPATHVLVDYLRKTRGRWLRQRGTTALFLAATGRRISKATIGMIVRQAAKTAELDGRITPHSLRHAMATHMLRAGADVRHVQELLGHADITTTEIYTHVAVKDLLDVHARCHPRGR